MLQRTPVMQGHRMAAAPARAAPAPRRAVAITMRQRRVSCAAHNAGAEPHLQLGTAKLPSGIDMPVFQSTLYQWATTLTQSGGNLPFAVPLRVDRLEAGLQVGLLKRLEDKSYASAADIAATVEEVPGTGSVLFIRFFEGPAAAAGRQTPMPADPNERLEVVLQSLVDVTLIMTTMPTAIKKAIQAGGMAAQAR